MRAIIVDDEKKGREILEFYLEEYFPSITIVELCDSVVAASKILSTQKVDLIFLDINMPNQNGFDLFETVNLSDKYVVFVTAHSEHAVKAFDVGANDYLLKPISLKGLQKCVSKMNANFKNAPTVLDNLILKVPNGNRVVKVEEVEHVSGDGNYTTVVLTNEESIIFSKNLKTIESEYFSRIPFVRIHQSYLININHIKSYNSKCVLMKSGHELPISRSKIDDFELAIKHL